MAVQNDAPVAGVDAPIDAFSWGCPVVQNPGRISLEQFCSSGELDARPSELEACAFPCPYTDDPERDVARWCEREYFAARDCVELERALEGCAACAAR